ncbi:MAG: tetratricopeptide repeat protein [Chloroflexi bacterium]|nr:tetratricopeptide repeat protein [Chloroflexota bacterium]
MGNEQEKSTPQRAKANRVPNERLKAHRLKKNWTQVYVATMIGTSDVEVSRWETGAAIPTLYFRDQLCALFSATSEELGFVSPGEMPQTASEQVSALWNVPHRRNPFFTGREEVLARLAALLGDRKATALTQVAASGLGGIGKTQTAIEYAYRHRHEYEAVLWVRADTPENCVSSLAALVQVLNLPEQEDADQERLVQAVTRWLKTHTNWLLILDNVEDVIHTAQMFSFDGPGHVLLTTRAQATGTVAQRLDLEQMTPEEGALFLLRRAKLIAPDVPLEAACQGEQDEARAISWLLDGLPLALDQAGAYIEETACGLSGYEERYQRQRAALLNRRGRLAADHPESVSTTLSLSLEKVEHLNPVAAELLRLCAFLDPDVLPEALLTEGASELSPALQPIATDPLAFDDALVVLRTYSLVRRNPDAKTLSIHRLVQAVLKDRMDEDEQRGWAERAVRLVNAVFPAVSELSAWPTCRRYLPHAQVCAELIEHWDMDFPEAARLLHQTGAYLRERAQYVQAERFLSKARDLRLQAFGPMHPAVAESLHELAELAWRQGKCVPAESLYQQALAIREQTLGAEHPDVATSLHRLAVFYYYHGEVGQDEPLYLRALTIRQKTLGPEHPDVATILNDLALLYHDRCRDRRAESLYQRALTIFEQTLGPKHPMLAMALNNLGRLYLDQGRYEQAEPLIQSALAIMEEMFGPEHPAVAFNLGNLARIHLARGEYAQAERLHRRALAVRQQALGPEHRDVAIALMSLGECYLEQRKYKQAEPLFLRALVILEKTQDPQSYWMGHCLYVLAKLNMAQARYEQAEPLFHRALPFLEKIQDDNPLAVAALLEDSAVLLSATKREMEAAKLLERAREIRAKCAEQNMS